MNFTSKPRRTTDFLIYLFRSFINDRCPVSAGMLSYTSLLSLVPLMVLGFALFAAFPVFNELTGKVQGLIFSNLVPATGEVVKEYLTTFVEKASGLTAPGIVFLLVTALLLISTIDRELNAIWKVYRRRNLLGSFIIYWAILTLGPLLVGFSLVISSYLVSLSLSFEVTHGLADHETLFKLLSFLAVALAFTLLYAIVPYRHISLRHAVAGGTLAAALFELAKKIFTLYITHMGTYEAIYGALAAVPIFLIWIYISWLVILLGAEFTHCLGSFRHGALEQGQRGHDLVLAFRLLGHLGRFQEAGEIPSAKRLLGQENGVDEFRLDYSLSALQRARIVHRTESGGWALSRDLHTLTLAELYHSDSYVLPVVEPSADAVSSDATKSDSENIPTQDPWEKALNRRLMGISSHLRGEALNVPLAHLYRESASTHA
uniref:UPF0761 membrane protein BECKFW1821B_GA0114236_10562 n=1 Tax=Candidatus Kentrum sp. FW TaxID=2126338 RepID=A0A450T1I8_9GAMM|nr:MAG: tRNA-processing RNAse BN [Candidatus Kentron sp. FW]